MEGLKYREILNEKFRGFKGIRNFTGFNKNVNKVILDFTSVSLEIEYFTDEIVKVFISERKEGNTNAIILQSKRIDLNIHDKEDRVEVCSKRVKTVVCKKTSRVSFYDMEDRLLSTDFDPSFKRDDGKVFISKVNDSIAYYGLGEKGGDLNKKGCYTENFNTDDPETDDESMMYYKTIPFFIGFSKDKRYGLFFDNSFRSFFDMGKEYGDRIYFGADGGEVQYYFIYGDSLKEVVSNYGNLTGRMEMPPLWSLGYQQNRFSYFDVKEVRDVIREFEERDIPIDVIYLDIDYMDGFRVMTFKSPQFDGVEKLIEELHKKGIKVVT
ncbi:MAG: TIM-barrel domain-containing protein, partial [Clostridium sp.]